MSADLPLRREPAGAAEPAVKISLQGVSKAFGEKVVLDSGHLVAFDPSVEFITRKVTKGIMQTLKSGEGFVMEFTGPGRILTQTRNPQGLVGWLTEALPFSREN